MADDQEIWNLYKKNITPLKKDEAIKESVQDLKPKKVEKKPSIHVELPRQEPIQSQKFFDPNKPAGVDANSFARLKKGKLPIEDRLDLHGLTIAEAHQLLENKIQQWHQLGVRVVLIITGKGLHSRDHREAIRYQFPIWIRRPTIESKILAYCQAHQKDGGAGAYYLLLKSKKS